MSNQRQQTEALGVTQFDYGNEILEWQGGKKQATRELSKLLIEGIMEEQSQPNPELAAKQKRLLEKLSAEHREATPNNSIRLTPSEIDALRQDKVEAAEKMREYLRNKKPKTGWDEK